MKIKNLFTRLKEIPVGTPVDQPCPYRYGERSQFKEPGALEIWIKSRFREWPAPDVLFFALMDETPEEWTGGPDD